MQGKRESNEDQHYVLLNINGAKKELNNINFFSVFDGHGGKIVSKYLKDNLPILFLKKLKKNIYLKPEICSEYINKVYDIIQKKLIAEHPRAVNYCGSTACVTIQCYDSSKKKSYIWVINVGDSRAILINKNNIAVQLSKDHKPNTPEERQRIENLNGKLTFDGVDWRINGLSLSRAFGDIECTPCVTHLPQIYRYKLSPDDKFLVLACDGLWDVLSNQDVADFLINLVNKKFTGNYAKNLCEYAYSNGSMDNISAIVYIMA